MNEITSEQFAMICFLVLMQNGEGLTDKAPSYIFEKSYMLRSGFDAFGALDVHNMRIAVDWCKKWHVKVPEVIQHEIDLQEQAAKELREQGFEI